MYRMLKALIVAVVITTFLGIAPATVAAIKCWTNKDGVRECGNVVPPEYSQQEQTEMSKTGVTTGKTDRAKTPEELEQERQAAAAKGEEERKAKERAEADRQLMDTYASENDIVLARDGRMAEIESRIKLARSHIDKLNKNLNDIIEHAAAMERRGEQPGEKVEKDIESVRQQIRDQEKFIATKRTEQEAIQKQYDADLVRYREMKTRLNAAATETTSADAKAP